MITELFQDQVKAMFGAAAGWIGYRAWSAYRTHFSQRHIKLTYFRVVRLRFEHDGAQPYYTRANHTSSGPPQPVFDETLCINSTHCSIPSLLDPVQMTSSGTVDAVQVLPTIGKDTNNHPHNRSSNSIFTFSSAEKTNGLSAVGTLINGLQDEDNWWFGTTAQYANQTVVLVVDFSSLPCSRSPIFNTRSVLERDKTEVPKSQLNGQWFEDQMGSSLYYARMENAKKGDVIRFTFEVDANLLGEPNGIATKQLDSRQPAARSSFIRNTSPSRTLFSRPALAAESRRQQPRRRKPSPDHEIAAPTD